MATQILQVIKEALETHNHELLVFTELDPKVSSEILDNLLHPMDKTTAFATDGYLKVVMPTALHETAVRWMVEQLVFWGYDHLLTPAAIRAVWCGLITYDNFVGAFGARQKHQTFPSTPILAK
ncbi:hypothetical protein HOY80DRAFT_1068954 [Tuber brumale]|nr:hypothetical protein HOY80DRAFT_1068954 [Tuber brumale]